MDWCMCRWIVRPRGIAAVALCVMLFLVLAWGCQKSSSGGADARQARWVCVVCGGPLPASVPGRTHLVKHEGKSYRLCSPKCLQAFGKDPEAYIGP